MVVFFGQWHIRDFGFLGFFLVVSVFFLSFFLGRKPVFLLFLFKSFLYLIKLDFFFWVVAIIISSLLPSTNKKQFGNKVYVLKQSLFGRQQFLLSREERKSFPEGIREKFYSSIRTKRLCSNNITFNISIFYTSIV